MQYDTTSATEIEDRVRAYILDSFLTPAQAETFGIDDDLLQILD